MEVSVTMAQKTSKVIRNRGGKFIRRNQNIADYGVSKSVDYFTNKSNTKPHDYPKIPAFWQAHFQ
jgi:hypothetical protein